MIYQWHIFLVSLGPVVGAEQAGTRPVLIVSQEQSNQVLRVVNIVPITSRKSPQRTIYSNEVLLPAHEVGLKVDSIALCQQIRTIDKQRLGRELAILTSVELREAVSEALRFQLEL